MNRIAASQDGRPPPDVSDRHVAAAPSGALLEGETPLLFGRYRLFRRQRQLLREDRPIDLGPRAFDLLLILVESDGKLITKDELRKRVWPTTLVENHNIDIQLSALRKALGGDRDMIRTEAGRGYRFVAMVSPVPNAPPTNLPAPISQLVGRKHELAELQDLIAAHRLLTLTGTGGIGKTQLGLAAAHRALPRFPDGAWVVELGPLIDPELIPGAVALALGIEPGSSRSVVDQLVAVLSRKRLLLVLDNCEHVIEAAALTAETLLLGVPGLHVLATSQEPLAAAGEHIYPVAPLKVPPTEIAGAAQALEHSAVQLFVERAQAANPLLALDDGTAAAVSKICRHLDGIPLAIELAAARAATMGVEAVARRLDDRFRLLTGGRRKALRRHQTLRAALDWSYGLLEDAERAVLRRLAIFAGSFALDSAASVAAGEGIDDLQAANHVADLVRKSLLTFEAHGATARYRLLDTTRAYALEKLAESGEFDSLARRHADHCRDLMERAAPLWQTAPAAELVAKYAPEIDNIRAALDWAFEPHGDPEIGVALAAASVPLWVMLSMLAECQDFVGLALSRLDKDYGHQMRHEMVLQVALGKSSMWAEGPLSLMCAASQRALELAEELEDVEYQLQALYIQWIYRLRLGDYRATLAVANRFRLIAESRTDPSGALTGTRLEGVSFYYLGDCARARAAMERVLNDRSDNLHCSFVVRFGLDQRVAALRTLARILWLQGFPDQAMDVAEAGVEEARASNHANSLCVTLCDIASVAAMSGDLGAVDEFAAMLIDLAEKHGLAMRRADGLAFEGWIAARRGDGELGVHLLRSALDGCRETRIELRHTIFVQAFAEALVTAGHVDEGLAVIHRALDESRRDEGRWCWAELLRIRGELTLREGLPTAAATAEKDFLEAVDVARAQGARSWELRTATSLARLWHSQGRDSEACQVLVPVYDWFTEGFETTDLKAAKALLDALPVGIKEPN